MSENILTFIPTLILATQSTAVLLVVLFIFSHRAKQVIISVFGKNALLFSFIIALTATVGSLFYSEIAYFEPCKLCWFQRIFMYPQVVLLGMALFKKDMAIAPYAVALSVLGGAIALYHYSLQRGIAPELPCSAVGYAPTCAQVFVMSYGYITIPLMAFTAFALICVLLLLGKRAR